MSAPFFTVKFWSATLSRILLQLGSYAWPRCEVQHRLQCISKLYIFLVVVFTRQVEFVYSFVLFFNNASLKVHQPENICFISDYLGFCLPGTFFSTCSANLFFFEWRDFHLIRWIRQIGQNHPCISRIQLELHISTENILV